MAAALRQETTPVGNSATGSSITSNALGSPALVGSTIEVWLALAANPTISSVVDSASQTYTFVGSINDPTDGSYMALYALYNNLSATALSATANFTISGERNIQIREISGTNNLAPDTSNFPAPIVDPGSTITIALTSSASSGLISGVIADVGGSSSGLTAGAGFTGTVSFASGKGFGTSLFETAPMTGSGANNALWSVASGGGSSTWLGGAVIWDSGASPFTPFTKTQFFVTDTIVQQ